MRCATRSSTLTPFALNGLGRSLVGFCALSMVSAFAATPPVNEGDIEAQLNVLSRLEARTLQLANDVAVWVYLEGESFQGQSVQLEQKGLVIYEQQLVDGSFRIKAMPTFD